MLAIVLGVDDSVVNKIVSDQRPVSADMAIVLGEVLTLDPDRILTLQKSYDLAKAQITAKPDPKRSQRAKLFGGLPVSEMIKRGWLPGVDDVRNVPGVESALTKFFEAKTLDDIEVLPHAPKKTYVSTPATPAQLAWLYRVKQIAQEQLVGRYSPTAVKGAIAKLDPLLNAAEEVRHVPRILNEAGIRFVIVESLKGARIDGVCFWLNDFSPVIGMSLRFDRLDNFWHVLRHEMEHVAQMHGKTKFMLDVGMESEDDVQAVVDDEERIANDAATAFCVPPNQMKKFWERKYPTFAERDIIGFARTIKVHPALIAGQLRRRMNRYDRFASLMVKVRSLVAPAATVDGWGDIVPLEEQA